MNQDTLQIVDFAPQYGAAFYALNEAWISQYFVMEEADRKSLKHPESYILAKGGHLLVALLGGQVVGVCALIAMPQSPRYDFELAKMAVAPEARGHGIGLQLMQAAISKAQSVGAQMLYLESNTVLAPAIGLYRKVGFTEVTGQPTPYQRCNIQMELRV